MPGISGADAPRARAQGVRAARAPHRSGPLALALLLSALLMRAAGPQAQVQAQVVVSEFARGVGQPTALAFDSTGNLVVAELHETGETLGRVLKVSPTGVVTPFASGLGRPFGLAVTPNDVIYTTDYTSGRLYRISAAGEVTVLVPESPAGPFKDPVGIAFKNGILYVVDSNGGAISKVTEGGAVTPWAQVSGFPFGLAFDTQSEDLFVSEYGTGRIVKVAPDGSVSTYVPSAPHAVALALDSAFNLYLVGGSQVATVTPDRVVSSFSYTNQDNQWGIAIRDGAVYLSNRALGTISRYVPCPPNRYLVPDTLKCKVCPFHYTSAAAAIGVSACSLCPRTSYIDPATQACSPCPSGSTSWSPPDQCQVCPANFFVDPATGKCSSCPYRSTSPPSSVSPAACTPCPRTSYIDPATLQCTPCPSGFTSANDPGVCQQCEANFYVDAATGKCRECKPGLAAPAGSVGAEACK